MEADKVILGADVVPVKKTLKDGSSGSLLEIVTTDAWSPKSVGENVTCTAWVPDGARVNEVSDHHGGSLEESFAQTFE